MEQKNILISALSVGVGLGIGLASGQSVTKWGANTCSSNAITPQKLEHEMLRLVIDGRETNVTFDQFPYYLRYPLFFLFSYNMPSFLASSFLISYLIILMFLYCIRISFIRCNYRYHSHLHACHIYIFRYT